ncbi:hypothetical protein V1264_013242 [Littorina saxatilis]|uniref:UspA domain-containing protein n=1 Tax=Littorina saxatilis TaxID=31220 RepID=A0AAN9BT09_9CAEN
MKERVVIIAMDGSESSIHAFNTVITYDPELLKEHVGKEKEVAKCLLQPYVDQLTSLGVKVKPAMLVCQDAGHSIVGMAEHEEAHLIVMGSRGHGKLRRTLIGSCSDYVINHAHVPVVVCRH